MPAKSNLNKKPRVQPFPQNAVRPAEIIAHAVWASEERGRRDGRQAKARQHLAAGLNVREAAARLKIGKTALYEALKAE